MNRIAERLMYILIIVIVISLADNFVTAEDILSSKSKDVLPSESKDVLSSKSKDILLSKSKDVLPSRINTDTSCYNQPWTYEYIVLNESTINHTSIKTIKNDYRLRYVLTCEVEEGFVLPITISSGNDLVTDAYGFIYKSGKCVDCYRRLVEDYFDRVSPTHYGKRAFEYGCSDEMGLQTGDYAGIASCYSLMYYGAEEKWPRHFSGQLSYNHVPQDIRVNNKSILRVLLEKNVFCSVIFRNDDKPNNLPASLCHHLIGREAYAVHCCCYYNSTQCYMPNRQKLSTDDYNDTYGTAADRFLHKKPKRRPLTCALGSIDEDSIIKDRVIIQKETQSFIGKSGACFSTFMFYKSSMTVELAAFADRRYDSDIINLKKNSICKLLKVVCPFDDPKNHEIYTVWCACRYKDLCNSQQYMKLIKRRKTLEGVRYCNHSVAFSNMFGEESRTYMCSIHYSYYHKKNMLVDTNMNAQLLGDPKKAYNNADGNLVLFEVDMCTGKSILPVFLQSCGSKGQWNSSKNCDDQLLKNVSTSMEQVKKKYKPCKLAHFNATSIEEAKKLLETNDKEFPDDSLFCYVQVTWRNGASKTSTKAKNIYEVKMGALQVKSPQYDDCVKALHDNLSLTSNTICTENQLCCCFVGYGFEKCNLMEGVLELIHRNSTLTNPKEILEEFTRSEDIQKRGCAISAAIDVLEAQTYGHCWESAGCFRFQRSSIFDESELGHLFKIYAACTSEIPIISMDYNMVGMAAMCMTVQSDGEQCFMMDVETTDMLSAIEEENEASRNVSLVIPNRSYVRLCCCGIKGCSKSSKNFGFQVN